MVFVPAVLALIVPAICSWPPDVDPFVISSELFRSTGTVLLMSVLAAPAVAFRTAFALLAVLSKINDAPPVAAIVQLLELFISPISISPNVLEVVSIVTMRFPLIFTVLKFAMPPPSATMPPLQSAVLLQTSLPLKIHVPFVGAFNPGDGGGGGKIGSVGSRNGPIPGVGAGPGILQRCWRMNFGAPRRGRRRRRLQKQRAGSGERRDEEKRDVVWPNQNGGVRKSGWFRGCSTRLRDWRRSDQIGPPKSTKNRGLNYGNSTFKSFIIRGLTCSNLRYKSNKSRIAA